MALNDDLQKADKCLDLGVSAPSVGEQGRCRSWRPVDPSQPLLRKLSQAPVSVACAGVLVISPFALVVRKCVAFA